MKLQTETLLKLREIKKKWNTPRENLIQEKPLTCSHNHCVFWRIKTKQFYSAVYAKFYKKKIKGGGDEDEE
jgi:hypothetical protein